MNADPDLLKLQSWARDNSFATTTTWQRNRISRKNMKNAKVSVSKWSCHNEQRQNAKNNNCVAWKHVHVVAIILSRVQPGQALSNYKKIKMKREKKVFWCFKWGFSSLKKHGVECGTKTGAKQLFRIFKEGEREKRERERQGPSAALIALIAVMPGIISLSLLRPGPTMLKLIQSLTRQMMY